MIKRLLRLEVPGLVRDYLMPYTEIFERVVIPKAQEISLAQVNQSEINKFKKEIEAYQGRTGFRQHYFIVYYGLMLCCLYCEKECLEIREPKQKLKKLDLVAKARSLICLTYQHKAYNLIPFVL